MARKVKCVDCGVLGYPKDPAWARDRRQGGVLRCLPGAENYRELSIRERENLRKGILKESPDIADIYACCAKDVVTFRLDQDQITKEYNQERECPHFLQHIPGLSPQEHIRRELSLKDEQNRRRWEIKQKVVWAIIGATMTVAIEVLVVVLVRAL